MRLDPATLALVTEASVSAPGGIAVEDFECSTTQCVFGGTRWPHPPQPSAKYLVRVDGTTLLGSVGDEWNKLRLARGFAGGLLAVEDYAAFYLEPSGAAGAGIAASNNDAAGASTVYLLCRVGTPTSSSPDDLAAYWIDRPPFAEPHANTYVSDAFAPATAEKETSPVAATFADDTGLCAYTTPTGAFFRRITRRHAGDACAYDFECTSNDCGSAMVCEGSSSSSVSATVGASSSISSSASTSASSSSSDSSSSSGAGTGATGGAASTGSVAVSSGNGSSVGTGAAPMTSGTTGGASTTSGGSGDGGAPAVVAIDRGACAIGGRSTEELASGAVIAALALARRRRARPPAR